MLQLGGHFCKYCFSTFTSKFSNVELVRDFYMEHFEHFEKERERNQWVQQPALKCDLCGGRVTLTTVEFLQTLFWQLRGPMALWTKPTLPLPVNERLLFWSAADHALNGDPPCYTDPCFCYSVSASQRHQNE